MGDQTVESAERSPPFVTLADAPLECNMARRKCRSCGLVGGMRVTEVQVERAGVRMMYMTELCITCTVALSQWLADVSPYAMEGLPFLASSKVVRSARANATASRVYRRLSTGVADVEWGAGTNDVIGRELHEPTHSR